MRKVARPEFVVGYSLSPYPESQTTYDVKASENWLAERTATQRAVLRLERSIHESIPNRREHSESFFLALTRAELSPDMLRKQYDKFFNSDWSTIYSDLCFGHRAVAHPEPEREAENRLLVRLAFCRKSFGAEDWRTRLCELELKHWKSFAALKTADKDSLRRSLLQPSDVYPSDEKFIPFVRKQTTLAAGLLGDADLLVVAMRYMRAKELAEATQYGSDAELLGRQRSFALSELDECLREIESPVYEGCVDAASCHFLRSELLAAADVSDEAIDSLERAVQHLGDADCCPSGSRWRIEEVALKVARRAEENGEFRTAHQMLKAIRQSRGKADGTAYDRLWFEEWMQRAKSLPQMSDEQRERLRTLLDRIDTHAGDGRAALLFDDPSRRSVDNQPEENDPWASGGPPEGNSWERPSLGLLQRDINVRRLLEDDSRFLDVRAAPATGDRDETERDERQETGDLQQLRSDLGELRELLSRHRLSTPLLLGRLKIVEMQMLLDHEEYRSAATACEEALAILAAAGLAESFLVAKLTLVPHQVWTEQLRTACQARNWKAASTAGDERVRWCRKHLGARHWITSDALRDLALVRWCAGRPEEDVAELFASQQEILDAAESEEDNGPYRVALSEHKGRHARRSRLLSGRDPLAHRSMLRQAQAEIGLGNLDRADATLQIAEKLCRQSCGIYHPDYLRVLSLQASVADYSQESDEALDLEARRRAISDRLGQFIVTIYRSETRTMTVQVATGSPLQIIRLWEREFADALDASRYVYAEEAARTIRELTREHHGADGIEALLAEANFAALWLETGDLVQAEESYRRLQAELERRQDFPRTLRAKLEHNRALAASRLGRLSEAEAALRTTLELIGQAESAPADSSEARMRTNHGVLLRRLGRFPEARQVLKQAKEALDRGGFDVQRTKSLALIEAELVDALSGHAAQALERLRAIEAAPPEGGWTPELRRQLSYTQGIAHFEQQQFDATVAQLTAAVRHSVAQLSVACEFQTPRQQRAAAEVTREHLDALLTVLEQHPKAARDVYDLIPGMQGIALQVGERLRAALEDKRDETAEPLRKAFEEVRELSRQIADLQYRASRPQIPNPGEDAPTTDRQRRAEMERLRRRRAERYQEITGRLGARSVLLGGQARERVAASLPDGSVLIDFVCYQPSPWTEAEAETERLLGFLVRPDGSVTLVPLGEDRAVVAAVRRWANVGWSGASPAAMELRAQLWEPFARLLRPEETLVFLSPDGSTTLVPFVALPGAEPNTFLIEEGRRFVSLSTPLILESFKSDDALPEPPPENPFVIEPARFRSTLGLLAVGDLRFGDPGSAFPRAWNILSGSGDELSSLRGSFETFRPEPTNEYRVLMRGMGTERRLLDLLGQAEHVHFATHGFFARDRARSPGGGYSSVRLTDSWSTDERGRSINPFAVASLHPGLFSGIVLSGANAPSTRTWEGDGLLTASEIRTLDLSRVQTVVLSACETALGDYERGECQLSLQWAFHAAGVRSCVSSLWKVPDRATSRLMSEFYKNLWAGESRIDALHNAQLWALRHPDQVTRGGDDPNAGTEPQRLSPKYWAAFMLSGDWRPCP